MSSSEKSSGNHYAVILSRFNEYIGELLLKGALEEFKRHEISERQISVFKVPGAFEIPVVAAQLCEQNKYAAIIALGTVIRGETPHFDYVCQAALMGIAELSRQKKIPILNGIITANTVEQAMDRTGPKGNLGAMAAHGAIDMVHLMQNLQNT